MHEVKESVVILALARPPLSSGDDEEPNQEVSAGSIHGTVHLRPDLQSVIIYGEANDAFILQMDGNHVVLTVSVGFDDEGYGGMDYEISVPRIDLAQAVHAITFT